MDWGPGEGRGTKSSWFHPLKDKEGKNHNFVTVLKSNIFLEIKSTSMSFFHFVYLTECLYLLHVYEHLLKIKKKK